MSLAKAYFMTEKKQKIAFQFNPDRISIRRANKWGGAATTGASAEGSAYARTGLDGPLQAQFSGVDVGSLDLGTLYFDTTHSGKPVTKETDKVTALLDVVIGDSSADNASKRPQWFKFHWGDIHSFKLVARSVGLSFTMFSPTGVPIRAEVTMDMMQFDAEQWGKQNPTSGTPRPHRVHRVSPGESLDRIAAHHYGSSSRWRTIAAANAIEDPLILRPGTVLMIPKQDEPDPAELT